MLGFSPLPNITPREGSKAESYVKAGEILPRSSLTLGVLFSSTLGSFERSVTGGERPFCLSPSSPALLHVLHKLQGRRLISYLHVFTEEGTLFSLLPGLWCLKETSSFFPSPAKEEWGAGGRPCIASDCSCIDLLLCRTHMGAADIQTVWLTPTLPSPCSGLPV